MTTTAPDGADGARLRPARRADLDVVHRIEQATFPQPWPYSAFERYLDEPGFLVADRAGRVVGYVVADTVANHGRPLGHVKDVAVDPEYRGAGIGSRLLSEALSILADAGAVTAKLEVRSENEAAIRLYRRFGFEHRRTVPGYYGDGDDALVMVTTLSDAE